MAGKIKNCSLFSRLLMIGMVVLLGTIAPAAAASDELEATRQEVKQLRQMVQELANEVNRLKDVKGREEDFRTEYQHQLQEIRDDVTKLNESPMVGLADTLGKIKLGGYGEIHGNFTEGSESDKVDFHRLVLYLGYDFADWIKFHSETELEHAFVKDNNGEISLEQAYFDFQLSDNFNIRAGRLLTPIGIINKTHEPPTFNGVERPNFSKYIIPTTWSANNIPDGWQERDLSRPSSRLVGHWISENGDHHVFYSLIDRSLQIGTYILSLDSYNTKPSAPIKLKILSEEPSGTQLIIRTFPNPTRLEAITGIDFSTSDIVCCIPKDGQSMSQEYTFLGERHLSIYRYVGGRVDPSSSFIPDHPK